MIALFRILILVSLCFSAAAKAQDTDVAARELLGIKGGYVAKKRILENARVLAYVPILLKSVGRGPQWNPGHPRWASVEQRIITDWTRINREYQLDQGVDPSYEWFDRALARGYAAAFSREELQRLADFHRSTAGVLLLRLERELLAFYPASLVAELGRAMIGSETLSGRGSELFRTTESRDRRDFISLFETETIIREESFRAGGAYAEASYPTVQHAALAASAGRIDLLRAQAAEHLPAIKAFVDSDPGRKERRFLARTAPVILPAAEDPARLREAESAFYKKLEAVSAQWRALAGGTASSEQK